MGDVDLQNRHNVPLNWLFRYVDIGGIYRAIVQEASETWRVTQTQDETVNDSDKTFTVPADTEWQILWVWVEYQSSAAVGDRQLVVEVQNEDNDVIVQWARAGAVQAASLLRYYQFAPCVADLSAFRDTDYLTTPIPPTGFLKAADQLRIYDNNAVAAAADTMIIQIQYAYRLV